MKICITSTGKSLESPIDPRFGRCSYFLIVDSETLQFEAIQNIAANAAGGAGIHATQIIAKKGVNLLLTRNVGPKAFQALSSACIKIYTGESKTGLEFIEKFKKSELRLVNSPSVPVNKNIENKNIRKIGGE